MLEFDRNEQRTARRNHICQLCRKPILRGNEYIYESQKYDGKINTYKRHIHCDALLDAFLKSDWFDGQEYTDDEVHEWLCDQCNILFHHGKCSEEDYYEKCDMEGCFECELVQEKVLTKPEIFRAAKQSARDNARREGMN